MVRTPIAIIALSFTSAPCLAQSATVTATHDHPTGLVQPGESVRISFSTTWTGATQLARVVGDAVASPNVGIATNNSGAVGQGPLINYGTPSGGSVVGADVGSGPDLGWGWSMLFMFQPVTFLYYDWTAPEVPGTVAFDWIPHQDFPHALFYLNGQSVIQEALPTTYIGTSLTVVPAPGGAAVAVAAGILAWARRRRRE